LRSMAEVYRDPSRAALPIGSLKANLGHLITVAGVAGLIKVLAAMRHQTLPPTPHVETPNPELDGSPFRVLGAAEPWRASGPRRAALSAFGFGGNNAHLLVEEHFVDSTLPIHTPRFEEVAIVGLGARVANGESAADLAQAIERAEPRLSPAANGLYGGSAREVELPLAGLRFPPADLEQTLGQQTLLLAAAFEAVSGRALPAERTGVFVGAQCDAEVARYGARWRAAEWASEKGLDAEWLDAAREAFTPVLRSAGVLGTMPNIPANRLSSQLDLGGPSHTVASEELSGVRALEIAQRALAAGEVDVALACAVDLSVEPVHARALAELTGVARTPGDAAVVLVLKRLEDAKRDGDPVLAVLTDPSRAPGGPVLGVDPRRSTLDPLFGHAHAASGLLHVAVAALHCGGLVRLGEERTARVFVEAQHEQRALVCLRGEPGVPWSPAPRAAGTTRAFAAHAPSPAIPRAAREFPQERELTMQRMDPAPRLPLTTEAALPEAPAVAHAVAAPAPAQQPAFLPPAAPAPMPQLAAPAVAQPVAVAQPAYPVYSAAAAFAEHQQRLASRIARTSSSRPRSTRASTRCASRRWRP
ncbi:MAG: hypothetical protein H5U40_08175, partial [Polyangiaceae bacterium]|nr:hypothetical protein [Polyangiaceae bacterium]